MSSSTNGPGPRGWDKDERILSRDACTEIASKVTSLAQKGGQTIPVLTSWWTGELRWGRNRVTLASDRRDMLIRVRRQWPGSIGQAETNQADAESLEGAVRAAERNAAIAPNPNPSFTPPGPEQTMPQSKVWSDATYNLTTEARAEIANTLADAAEAKGLLSAGYIEVRAGSWLQTINGVPCYVPYTQAQCSITVRDPQGMGSGWAGLSSYDWAKIDAPALAQRALEKCIASRNPVALEPGRYTVILEPQAVADLLQPLVQQEPYIPDNFSRVTNESGTCCAPFQLKPLFSKLGLKVMDERLTMSHDPMDPELGIVPEPGLEPVTWVDKGILTNLSYDRAYALRRLRENRPIQSPSLGYRMSGGTTSIEEMIASTQRGLLVTRLWGVHGGAITAMGFTRDGLWLIENGKITKPVKNFRFVQSPLVTLNQIEQLGVPVPVFRPMRKPNIKQEDGSDLSAPPKFLTPAVVPPLKVRDFSFTAMADAV